MSKPFDASDPRPPALMLTPEAPYPLTGGGALRTASLLEFIANRYQLDVIAFREPGATDPAAAMPDGLVRRIVRIELPFHSRSPLARAVRNAHRYFRDTAPLIDRFAGFETQIEDAVAGHEYQLGIIEHFWCAPYCELLQRYCKRVVLDLHNIESVLLARCADAESFPRAAIYQRFARTSRRLEKTLLPCFSALLVTSESDAAQVRNVEPDVRTIVYPNAVPLVDQPNGPKQDAIVFSGNLEYEPNRTAVTHFHRCIWPDLKLRWPSLRWRIVGRNHSRVLAQLAHDPRVDVIGPVDDAIRELACAKVAIAPLLSGSGTRIKIIEAWAAGVPVVSTSIGAEGLPCVPGEHVLIADEPGSFVNAVCSLLTSEQLSSRLSTNSRSLYESALSWPAVWQRLQSSGL